MKYIRRIIFTVLQDNRERDRTDTVLYRFRREAAGSEAATTPRRLTIAGVEFEYDGKPSVDDHHTRVLYNYVPCRPASDTKLPDRNQYVPLLSARDKERLPEIVCILTEEMRYTLKVTDLRGNPLT